jgi:hypothetical protein
MGTERPPCVNDELNPVGGDAVWLISVLLKPEPAMSRPSFLTLYSVVATTLLGGLFVTDAVGRQERTAFDEIDVKRINIREDDGTLRMTISNTDRFPGIIIRGEERPHPNRTTAGMLFFNDEGTENGGLIFGGRRGADGVEGWGHLSFDQFEQDQVVALNQIEGEGRRSAGLTVSDRPDASIEVATERLAGLEGAAREAEIERLAAEGQFGETRAFFGKTRERASQMELSDAEGRPRLRLSVSAEGAAVIQFLDAAGRVTRTVTPEG